MLRRQQQRQREPLLSSGSPRGVSAGVVELDSRLQKVENNFVAFTDAQSKKLKQIHDRVASLRAAVRSDIAGLSQETHSALEDALQTMDSKLRFSKEEMAESQARSLEAVDAKISQLQESFDQTLATYEEQLVEDFQELLWKVQQNMLAEVDARIDRAMKVFNRDHSKQVGFEFDRMDFKIKGMSANAAGSSSEGVGDRCVHYVTSMFIVGFMTLVELLTYLSMPFTALARCCREKRCSCKKQRPLQTMAGAAAVSVAARKFKAEHSAASKVARAPALSRQIVPSTKSPTRSRLSRLNL